MKFDSRHIGGMRVDATSYQAAADQVMAWARQKAHIGIAIANVHMTIETIDSPTFRTIINSMELVTPDGMPLVWMLRRYGVHNASRVRGPTLTLEICKLAAILDVPVGFYGGSERENAGIVRRTTQLFPDLRVAFAYSPPFRALTPEEDDEITRNIKESGARILFVGLGCPKQERWIHEHKAHLPLVQLGVGAAFALHAGEVRQAPEWIQRMGLEWAFRLAMEPRRLWKRYLIGNSRFIALVVSDWVQSWRRAS